MNNTTTKKETIEIEASQPDFFTDFSALSLEIKNPIKTTPGYANRYQYAELSDILDQIKPILARHNFILTGELGESSVRTSLIHKNGKELSAFFSIPDFGGDAQKLGSFLSYSRRYSILQLLEIAQQDDDGQATKGSSVPAKISAADLDEYGKKLAVKLMGLPSRLAVLSAEDAANTLRLAKEACAPYPQLLERLSGIEADYFGV